MYLNLGLWFASPNGHEQGLQRQGCMGAALHRPTNDPPRKQVDHNSKIQKSFVGANLGDIGDPKLVGGIHVEPPTQGIARHDGRATTIRSGFFLQPIWALMPARRGKRHARLVLMSSPMSHRSSCSLRYRKT